MKVIKKLSTVAMFIASGLLYSATIHAQEKPEFYPSRPIKLGIGFPPGGSTDAPVRLLAEKVSAILKQPIIVENKPGAGGVLPTQFLQAAQPDGYTLAIAPASVFRMPYTTDIKWDPSTDLSYIVGITGYAFGIVVPANSTIKNLQEYLAYAKANPGKLTYSTPGVGTTNHLTMEQISRQYGISLNHIPYKGSAESLQAVLAGQVESAAETSAFVPHVDSGKMRLLAVWGKSRLARYPNVPTLVESGINIVQTSPWGLVGPKGMNPIVVKKLHDAFQQAMDTKEFKDMLARYEMEVDYRNSVDYQMLAVESMKREKGILDALGLSRK